MFEFIVKKAFPRRPLKEGTDVSAPHSVKNTRIVEEVSPHPSEEEHIPALEPRHIIKKTRRVLQCPLCNVKMEMRKIGKLEIDQCPQCEGVFLDRGELRILSGVEDSYFQEGDHKFLIYTPHGLTDSVSDEER